MAAVEREVVVVNVRGDGGGGLLLLSVFDDDFGKGAGDFLGQVELPSSHIATPAFHA